jgi:hypothetical protein
MQKRLHVLDGAGAYAWPDACVLQPGVRQTHTFQGCGDRRMNALLRSGSGNDQTRGNLRNCTMIRAITKVTTELSRTKFA